MSKLLAAGCVAVLAYKLGVHDGRLRAAGYLFGQRTYRR